MFAMNGMNYEQTLDRIARDVILQSAGSYLASMFWTQRDQIAKDMLVTMDTEFRKAHTQCLNLQILYIELP